MIGSNIVTVGISYELLRRKLLICVALLCKVDSGRIIFSSFK